MPSPFPGMDPYLEDAELFPDLHDALIIPFVEIYTGRGKKRRLVTSIEILSPANKTPGEHGAELFRQKQEELAASKVNLVEIDLLRGGEHTTAVPREELIDQAGACDYHVCCWRFNRFEEYRVYPVQPADRLPNVAIPLLPGDADVLLPLQPLFDQVYDAGPYPRVVDYRDEVPPPPLSADKRRWVKRRLSEAGLLAKK